MSKKPNEPRNNDEDGPLFDIKRTKTNSTGPDMIARRREAREDQVGNELSSVFGMEFMEAYEYGHRRGAGFDRHTEIYPPSLLDEMVKRRRLRLPQLRHSLHTALREITRTNEGAKVVMQLLEDYFMQVPDIDAMVEKYGVKAKVEKTVKELKHLEMVLAMLFNESKKETDASMMDRVKAKALALKIISQYDYKKGYRFLSDTLMLEVLRAHKNSIAEKAKKILEMLPQMQLFLKSVLHNAIDQGALPLEHSTVDERLDAIEVRVIDNLVARLSEINGQFESDTHTISIAANVPDSILRKVFVHEALHALSGQNDSIEVDRMVEEPENFHHSDQTRIGLLFCYQLRDFSSDNTGQLNFQWLNEAMTEQMTVDMLGEHGATYAEERKLLNLLIEKGIPKELFLQAYFENYEIEREGHKNPALKALFKAVDARFGKGFFVNLDHYITSITREEKGRTFQEKRVNALKKVIARLEDNASELCKAIGRQTQRRVIEVMEG